MPISISVRSNVKELTKTLSRAAYEQLPFATALAVTAIAKKIREAETRAMPKVFDRPTPFTVNSVGVKGATKGNPQAIIFVRDIAAKYLEPFEFGGRHVLGSKRALLAPKNVNLNQFGNLPRNTVKRLKGRKDIFVGSITTKRGEKVNGVWQRPSRAKGVSAGPLKLLIRFSDPLDVKQHLDYRKRAEVTAKRWFNPEFTVAMRKALATAK